MSLRVEDGVGPGPPLVLVHGVGLDHTMWDHMVPRLTASPIGPAQVVRYDLLGHGRTADQPGPRCFDEFVTQLNDVADQVQDEVGSQVDLFGLSLGGAIVRGAAARTPNRFGRVVIANAVFDRTPEQRRGNEQRLALAEAEGMDPVAELAVDRWFTEPWRTEHPDRLTAVRNRLRTTDLGGYLKAYRVFVDGDPLMPHGLADLTNPTLVVTGERDTGSTPAMAEAMAAILPDATLAVLTDTGHLPPIEHPDRLTELVLDFLERTP